MKKIAAIVFTLIFCATISISSFAQTDPKMRLRVRAPDRVGDIGIMSNHGWVLEYRLEIKDAITVAESDINGEMALVLTDPDGCLDLRGFGTGFGGSFENCPAANANDELIVPFHADRFDDARIRDDFATGGTFLCEGERRDALADDPPPADLSEIVNLNKPYIFRVFPDEQSGDPGPPPGLAPVGPSTGGVPSTLPAPDFSNDRALDCYGFGADEALPGMVIMADIGGARVFDEEFVLENEDNIPDAREIRNMAGFISSVSFDLGDYRGESAITAAVHVRFGMFEPIVLYDRSFSSSTFPNADFLRQRDSGPIEALEFDGQVLGSTGVTNAMVASNPLTELTVRAVLVDGQAPDRIKDMDGNGIFSAADVAAMGYTLRSNEIRYDLVIAADAQIGDFFDPVCSGIILTDLDDNGASGVQCESGSGRSGRRTRR